MTANLPAKKTKFDDFAVNANEDFVTMMISDQLFTSGGASASPESRWLRRKWPVR